MDVSGSCQNNVNWCQSYVTEHGNEPGGQAGKYWTLHLQKRKASVCASLKGECKEVSETFIKPRTSESAQEK